MILIILILLVVTIIYYSLFYKEEGKKEHFSQEAIDNVASLYNTGKFTVTNLGVTDTLTLRDKHRLVTGNPADANDDYTRLYHKTADTYGSFAANNIWADANLDIRNSSIVGTINDNTRGTVQGWMSASKPGWLYAVSDIVSGANIGAAGNINATANLNSANGIVTLKDKKLDGHQDDYIRVLHKDDTDNTNYRDLAVRNLWLTGNIKMGGWTISSDIKDGTLNIQKDGVPNNLRFRISADNRHVGLAKSDGDNWIVRMTAGNPAKDWRSPYDGALWALKTDGSDWGI